MSILNNATTKSSQEGDGIALYAIAHPSTRSVRLHAWAPWYKRCWWGLTGQVHVNPDHLETVEIEISDNWRDEPELKINPRNEK